jgi:uncharacterized membrane protein YagU involved in acid resistance
VNVRLKGLLKSLGYGAVFATIFPHIYDKVLGSPAKDSFFKLKVASLIAMSFPGAFALAGFIEAVTGLPFTQLSKAWNGLTAWQRGLYGLLAVTVASVVIFFVLALVLAWAARRFRKEFCGAACPRRGSAIVIVCVRL